MDYDCIHVVVMCRCTCMYVFKVGQIPPSGFVCNTHTERTMARTVIEWFQKCRTARTNVSGSPLRLGGIGLIPRVEGGRHATFVRLPPEFMFCNH